MLSLNIEVLSEKGIRSTVACTDLSVCILSCFQVLLKGNMYWFGESYVFSTTLAQGPSSHSLCTTSNSAGVVFGRQVGFL